MYKLDFTVFHSIIYIWQNLALNIIFIMHIKFYLFCESMRLFFSQGKTLRKELAQSSVTCSVLQNKRKNSVECVISEGDKKSEPFVGYSLVC